MIRLRLLTFSKSPKTVGQLKDVGEIKNLVQTISFRHRKGQLLTSAVVRVVWGSICGVDENIMKTSILKKTVSVGWTVYYNWVDKIEFKRQPMIKKASK